MGSDAPADGRARDRLSYALVTPARNEARNLSRLAACVSGQTVRPVEWVIVENGSTDDTLEAARTLGRKHPWIRVVSVPGASNGARGGAIVRALAAGISALKSSADVVVNLDADVSMGRDYFERLLASFEADATLGIASGSAYEFRNGSWRQQFATRQTVWGATRAYRAECLRDVSPLEERLGWDGIDELQATVRGWKTKTLLDLPFWHHRVVGQRDGSWAMWSAEGRLAHYMGYRVSYLLARLVYRCLRERTPMTFVILWGYTLAALRREPRWADAEARRHLRELQRPRFLAARAREALGRR
jgi:glycosyltransferase involved in cell wall biosynthesis